MMRRSITVLVTTVCFLMVMGIAPCVLSAGQSSDDYTIVSDVLSGGGARVTSTDYVITGTIGQPAIIGSSDSTNYDVQHGFWAQIQSPCLQHGDLNGSGSLTAEDAQIAFFIVLGMVTPTEEQLCAADCDGNGSITAGDAQTIFFSILGMGSCVDEVPVFFDNDPYNESIKNSLEEDNPDQLYAEIPTENILWVDYSVNRYDMVCHADMTLENNSIAVDAFTMEILFDADLYKFVQCKEGSVFSNWFEFECREVEPGRVVIAAYTVDDEIPQDSLGTLVQLAFELLDNDFDQNDLEFILMDDLTEFVIE